MSEFQKRKFKKKLHKTFGIFESDESLLEIRYASWEWLSSNWKSTKHENSAENNVWMENQMKSIIDDFYETLLINKDSFES